MITVDFKRLSIKSGYKILDMGCGSGRHLCEAARRPGVMAIGSDLNYNDLTKARDRINFHKQVGEYGGGPWGLLTSDVTRLPFPDDCFDLVICSEVLEHIPDHEKAMSELVRVLKPGCDLVVSVPRYLPEKICWSLSDDYFNSNGGHVRIYRAGQIKKLLRRAGTELRDSHFAHGLHSPYWWLKCLVGPTREDDRLVKLYHAFLVWDIMKKPRLTRTLDRLLNPVIGKSLVLYLRKNGHDGRPLR